LSLRTAHADYWTFCHAILPDVSRSFALIIPSCPEPLDKALCVAYLICRAADTIEDNASLGDNQRAVLYDALLSAVDEPEDPGLARAFRDAWPAVPDDACGPLIEGFDLVLSAYRSLPGELHPPIRNCVHEMVAGMRSLRAVETHDGIAFLCRDLSELDKYCHYVAGTVGVMSTALFEARLDSPRLTATPEWREDGRRLGLGLQMTNIIKDCHVDAARGVSFIPAGCVDLTSPSYRLRRSGRVDLIGRAISHLDAGLRYVLAVPAEQAGIRTFLLGSLLPAIATLEVAVPGTRHHPKIDRAEMTEIFDCIHRHLADNDALTAWYTERRRRTLAALTT